MIRNDLIKTLKLLEIILSPSLKRLTRVFLLPVAYLLLVTCDEILDIAPPEVEIVSPTQGEIDTGYVHIKIKASDNRQLDYVDLYFDGKKIKTFTVETKSRASPKDTVDLADYQQDRNYKIEVKAYDVQGNWETDAVTCFGYGKSPATPTLVSPSANASLTTQPTFQWNAIEGAISYQLVVDDNEDFTTPEIDEVVTGSEYVSTDTLIGGTNYWKVRARNNVGLWGSWSSAINFTIAGPEAPTLVDPPNGTVFTNTAMPTFSWNSSTNAVDYQILVDNNQDFASPEIDGIVVGTGYTSTVSLNAGVNYWKVGARNNIGLWGQWSGTHGFTISGPVAPTLVSPANGALFTNTNTPTFSWNASTDAVDYEIIVDDNQNFGSPEIDEVLTETEYNSTVALSAGVNHWKVRARNNVGLWGDWSGISGFTISGPVAPTLVSPANGATFTNTNTPTFSWNASTDAVDYEIMVDDNPNFASPEIHEVLTETEYTSAVALSAGTNYWKVRGRNNVGLWGNWSETRSFTISGPPAPSLVSPANGSSLTSQPTFYWNPSSNAVDYQILVDNDQDFTSPEIEDITTSTEYISTVSMNPGTNYWKVRGRNNVGVFGDWSEVRYFTISGSPTPTLVSPANGSSLTSQPTFYWNPSSNAVDYQILMDNNQDFTSPEIDEIVNETQYVSTALFNSPTNYWKVRARNNVGLWGDWSMVWSFIISIELTEVGFYDTPGEAKRVAVNGNYAYIADYGSGLMVIDISNPTSPVGVGSYTAGVYVDVAVSGNYAYLVGGWAYGLRIIDIQSPSSPSYEGYYDTPGSAKGVTVSGNYAYVADGDYGLRVVNVSNPSSPAEVGYYDTPGEANKVAVVGNYAYVADGSDGGLRVINISNPGSPVEVGYYGTMVLDVAVMADYAYVVRGDYGLRVIDISDSSSPVYVGYNNTPGYSYGVAVNGNYVYIADGDYGLRVIDVSDPANPIEVGYYDTPGEATGIATIGNYAFVADGTAGLRVIDISPITGGD